MKYLFFAACILLTGCLQQKKHRVDLFTVGLAVSNLDSSAAWYKEILGLSVKGNKYEDPKKEFQQINLIGEDLEIVLVHFEASISRKQVLNEYGKRLQGFIQIGFHVSNFGEWEKLFKRKNIRLVGNINYDPFSGKRTAILTDPENNLIQISEE